MTVGTPQSQAIQNANSFIGVAQQLMNIYDQIQTLDEHWIDQQVAVTLSSFSTVGTTPDGGIGSPDAMPVNDHMIDISKYAGLSRSLSPLEITQIKDVVDAIRSYIDGQAVATNPAARAILNAATGG